MKLKNKKTGEIIETDFDLSISIPDDEKLYGCDTYTQLKGYTSLAELNEEWEDYEEKGWYITENGEVRENRSIGIVEEESEYREIGNYFDTREEAEKAVEKLKAWKRLRDKGFRFEYYDYSDRDLHNHIQIKAITNREVEDSMLYKEDLDLLFGGENDHRSYSSTLC